MGLQAGILISRTQISEIPGIIFHIQIQLRSKLNPEKDFADAFKHLKVHAAPVATTSSMRAAEAVAAMASAAVSLGAISQEVASTATAALLLS